MRLSDAPALSWPPQASRLAFSNHCFASLVHSIFAVKRLNNAARG
jgi:hypothetical protein